MQISRPVSKLSQAGLHRLSNMKSTIVMDIDMKAGGQRTKKKIALSAICLNICLIILFCSFSLNCFAQSEPIFEPLIYPEEAVTNFKEEMLDRVSTGPDYVSNRGYDESGLYMSPYWNCKISGQDIPVYAVMSYDEDVNRGVLQSVYFVY